MNPNFTLNYGLRYEINGRAVQPLRVREVFPDDANLYGPSTALFQPGQLNGVQNPVITRGKHPAPTDWMQPRAERRLRVDAELRERPPGEDLRQGPRDA